MKSGVFERMQRPWFRIERIDHPEKRITLDIGEDYSWCMNARRAGMKIMFDPSIKVDHHKEIVWHLR
jgi:GT2 family glycosyltransferase